MITHILFSRDSDFNSPVGLDLSTQEDNDKVVALLRDGTGRSLSMHHVNWTPDCYKGYNGVRITAKSDDYGWRRPGTNWLP